MAGEIKVDASERAALRRAHFEYLKTREVELEKVWASTPKLFYFGVLAIPTAFYSLGYAISVVLFTFALVGTAGYLRGVRRSECRREIEELGKELSQVPAPR